MKICIVWRGQSVWWWDGCVVLLKDRKGSEDFYSHLGIQSVRDVVRYGRLRWIGHLECKSADGWVSAYNMPYINVEVTRLQCRGRKTCVNDDIKLLDLEVRRQNSKYCWKGCQCRGKKTCVNDDIKLLGLEVRRQNSKYCWKGCQIKATLPLSELIDVRKNIRSPKPCFNIPRDKQLSYS